jgi:hypothetical protein
MPLKFTTNVTKIEQQVADLPLHLKEKLSVLVLDVSRPQTMIEAVDKRGSKLETSE